MLKAPEKRALEVVRDQSHDYAYDSLGNKKRLRSAIAGISEGRLDEQNRRDLAAIRPPAEKDLLSRLLQDHWMFKVWKFHSRILVEDMILMRLADDQNHG